MTLKSQNEKRSNGLTSKIIDIELYPNEAEKDEMRESFIKIINDSKNPSRPNTENSTRNSNINQEENSIDGFHLIIFRTINFSWENEVNEIL